MQDSEIMEDEVKRMGELADVKESCEMLNSGYYGSVGHINSQQLWLTAQTHTILSQSHMGRAPSPYVRTEKLLTVKG